MANFMENVFKNCKKSKTDKLYTDNAHRYTSGY